MTTGGTNVGEIRARFTLEMADARRQLDEMRRRIQDLEGDTRRGADGFRDMGGAIAGLGAGVALSKLVSEMRSAVDAATKLHAAFAGLNAVASGFGIQTKDAQQAAQDLAKRGFLSLTDSVLAYKTAMSSGLGLEESTKLITALADSAAYNRQSFYDMSGAIMASLNGIKNGNSVLSDAVGVTKNLSIMQKEYAASIGTTVGRLTDAQKIEAAYQGFLRETAIFSGNASEAMEGYTGSTARFTQATNEASVALGESFTPLFATVLEALTPAIIAFADFTSENKAMVSAVAASSVGVLGLIAILAGVPPVLKLIASGLKAVELSAGPVGWAILAIGAIGAGIGYITTANAEATAATKALAQAQTDLSAVLNKAPIDRTVSDIEELKSKTEELTPVLEERARLQERLNELQAAEKAGTAIPEMFGETLDLNNAIGELDEKLEDLGYAGVEQATEKLGEMNKFIKAGTIAITDQEKAEASALATKKQTLKEMSSLATQFKDLSSAQTLDATQKGKLVDITESLIEQYPALNAKQGEDGRIRADNIDVIIEQIATDKKFTNAAAEQVAIRIRNSAKETKAQAESVQTQIENLTRLSNALAIVSGANASTFSDDMAARTEKSRRQSSGAAGDIVSNGVLAQAATSKAKAEVDAKITEELKKQQVYADGARELEKLASAVETGAQTFTKDIIPQDAPKAAKAAKAAKEKPGKSPAELAADARKTLYENDLKTVQFQADFYNLTADKQIAKYDALKKKHAMFLKESVDDARTLNLQLKRLGEDSVQSRYDFSTTAIEQEVRRMEDSGKTEREIANQKLYLWQQVRNRYGKDSEQYKAADEQAYQARKDLAEATVKEEEALYKSREDLAKKTKDLADDLLDAQKDAIKKAKDADLDAIDARKKAALDDYDARIDAIQKLRDANKTLNADVDYDSQLAEKQARLGELGSAVGPEGIAERDALLKEIERMQLEHGRTLADRTLETQQQALSDEKAAQSDAYDAEKLAKEAQYDALESAFESYNGDIKTIEAGIAAFRVAQSDSANTTILTNLDTFLTSYRAKMSELASMQEAADLSEYNNNKNLYAAAKKAGNTAEATALAARNEALRQQYGVGADTGEKLQHFSAGGIVQGAAGAAVPAIVHGGEVVLTAQQQASLWDAISIPRMVAQSPSAVTNITQNIDLGIDEVTLGDKTDIALMYDERARLAGRLLSMGIKE